MSRNRSLKSERTRTRRPRTVSISPAERGQTTQDFAVGIGVFLLAIAFTFSFLPSIITPFDSSVGGAETAQADRIADLIVHNLSADDSTLSVSDSPGNQIDGSEFSTTYAEEDLSEEVGLRASSSDDTVYDRVNVTIETLDGDPVDNDTLAGGDAYDGQPATSAARIVTVADTVPSISIGDDCDPACRLVVRVW